MEIFTSPVLWVIGTFINSAAALFGLNRKYAKWHGYTTIALICILWYPTMATVSLFGILYYDPMVGPKMYIEGNEFTVLLCLIITGINAFSLEFYMMGMGEGFME